MDPSRLAEILAVLRDSGASRARIPIADWNEPAYLDVTFGPPLVAPADTDDGTEPPDEELPPGAFDPIAARRRLAKGK